MLSLHFTPSWNIGFYRSWNKPKSDLLFRVWSFPTSFESDSKFFDPILTDRTQGFTAEWIGCSSAIVVGSEDYLKPTNSSPLTIGRAPKGNFIFHPFSGAIAVRFRVANLQSWTIASVVWDIAKRVDILGWIWVKKKNPIGQLELRHIFRLFILYPAKTCVINAKSGFIRAAHLCTGPKTRCWLQKMGNTLGRVFTNQLWTPSFSWILAIRFTSGFAHGKAW